MARVEKLLSLGIYPDLTLSEARAERDQAKRYLAKGIDPYETRKKAKLNAKTPKTSSEQLQKNTLPNKDEIVARL